MDTISISTDNMQFSARTGSETSSMCIKKRLESRKILKNQLKDLQERNSELENLVQVKNSEIDELKKNITSLNDIINSVQVEDLGKGSTIATSKISELSRKNRQLNAEVEAIRGKYEKDHAKLVKLENEVNKGCTSNKDVSKRESNTSARKKMSCCTVSSNFESIQEELQVTKQKLFESLNQNAELRNNLKLAQKCIQQEIGENVNLNILAQSNTSWRGRAQQILSLQNKVAELKAKLEITSVDDSYRKQLRKLETAKKLEHDELCEKIKQLQAIIDEQKVKISALKIRNKNLSDETMNYKLKTLSLMEQSGENDNSIASMNEKFNIQKYQYEDKIRGLNKQIDGLKKQLQDTDADHAATKMKLENNEKLIENKQNEINELNKTIRQLEEDLRSVCGDFLFSCRDLKKDEFLSILNALESEKQGLQQLNKDLNERMEAERTKALNLSELASKQKIKIARLEGKIRDLQKEQENQQEKRKRSQRVAEYSNNLSSRLSTLVVENSNISNYFEPLTSSSLHKNDLDIETTKEKIECEKLKNDLELANEKIVLLEEKLNHLANEKENDSNVFNEIITNSKNILLNMIQQSRKFNDLSDGQSIIETQRFNRDALNPSIASCEFCE